MNAIELLTLEHQLIGRMIDVLSTYLRALRKKGHVDARLITNAVDFFWNYADQTHRVREDDIVFASVRKKDLDAKTSNVLSEIEREHRQEENIVQELHQAVERNKDTDDDFAMMGIVVVGLTKLATFYTKHMRKEEEELFPALRTYLGDEDERERVSDVITDNDEDPHGKYTAHVEELERMIHTSAAVK